MADSARACGSPRLGDQPTVIELRHQSAQCKGKRPCVLISERASPSTGNAAARCVAELVGRKLTRAPS